MQIAEMNNKCLDCQKPLNKNQSFIYNNNMKLYEVVIITRCKMCKTKLGSKPVNKFKIFDLTQTKHLLDWNKEHGNDSD